MRNLFLPVFIICGFIVMPVVNSAAVNPSIEYQRNDVHPKLTSLKVRDVEKKLGRKLTTKEKIAFFILKKSNPEKNPGNTALIFGVFGAALLVFGLVGVPYVVIGSVAAAIVAVVIGSVAKKREPDDKKANAATLLGWVTLGVIALVILILLAAGGEF